MPEVLEPPVAPPPSVSTPKAAPIAPPSAPKAEQIAIKDTTQPAKESLPAKKGSKMEDMFGELNKITKPEGPLPIEPVKEPEAAQEPEQEPAPEVSDKEPDTEEAEDKTPLEKQIAEEKRDRKAKAWPIVEKWRKVSLEQEQQIVSLTEELTELRKSKSVESPELNGQMESLRKELEDAKKQFQESQEELKYTAYERSQEFKNEYVKPYEEAWTRAIHDLKGLQVTLSDGTAREITWQDIGALANMEPDVRRRTIKEQFPDDVQEVTGHVKSIRELADKQKGALEKFRKEGDLRAQQRAESEATSYKARATEIMQAWNSENQEAPKHEKYGRYFSPDEADQEWSERLQRGFEKADAAFAVNPLDPKLTPEQRSDAVRRQAAQRNRAAAFSGLVYLLEKEQARAAELEAKLEEFQKSEPGPGDGKPATEAKSGSAWDRLNADLNALAK